MKLAALAAGTSYVIANELESRYAVLSDIGLLRKLVGYRKTVRRGFTDSLNLVDFWYEAFDQVGPKKVIFSLNYPFTSNGY